MCVCIYLMFPFCSFSTAHAIIPPKRSDVCFFSKHLYEEVDLNLTKHSKEILGDLPFHEDVGWRLPMAAVDVLKEFKHKCPTVVAHLEKQPSGDIYYGDELFPNEKPR